MVKKHKASDSNREEISSCRLMHIKIMGSYLNTCFMFHC